MQLGMIGLGRMGASMVRRLMKTGHECVVYNSRSDAKVTAPRAIWMMVPAGAVDHAPPSWSRTWTQATS
jgi:6-phosphogluconate dehydrogenase